MTIVEQSFLIIYLPIFVLIGLILRAFGFTRVTVPALLVMSVVFYLHQGAISSVALFGSILVTWAMVELMELAAPLQKPGHANLKRRLFAFLGVAVNLGLLLVFKYLGFFEQIFGTSADLAFFGVSSLIVPLGLSFFTIQQIGYVLDVYSQRASRMGLVHYSTFIAFFPQLMAGPIVSTKQMARQFKRLEAPKINDEYLFGFAKGMTLIAFGAFKVTIVSHEIFEFITPYILAAQDGQTSPLASLMVGLSGLTALYFDFSGYCDVAMGIGLLFGIVLPINFNAPFRNPSGRQFFANWHITFHNFLRDHVYKNIAGDRSSKLVVMFAIWATFQISALWHVPSVNMLVFANVLIVAVGITQFAKRTGSRVLSLMGNVLSNVLAAISLIFFLSPDPQTALTLAIGLVTWPSDMVPLMGQASQSIASLSVLIVAEVYKYIEIPSHALLSERAAHHDRYFLKWQLPPWRPSLPWAVVTIVLLYVSIVRSGSEVSIYYTQF